MKPQSHIVDLLNAAKLMADSQCNTLLSYIINMAMIEASTGAGIRKNEDGKTGVDAA
jgi:phosphoribosylformimino-5-aminoimidazole carboxamide ribonucleotide (ProFAR) isomerase